jgi:hypothetical protein
MIDRLEQYPRMNGSGMPVTWGGAGPLGLKRPKVLLWKRVQTGFPNEAAAAQRKR